MSRPADRPSAGTSDPVRVERTVASPDGSERIELVGERVRVEVLSYGAHLVGVWWPDRDGVVDNSVVSLRRADGGVDLEAYRDRSRNPYLGATVGRYANRLAGARVDLDGVTRHLVPNEGANQLHGGPDGFDRREWRTTTLADGSGAQVSLHLVSDDGDQGFPGRVEVTVTYRLDAAGVLRIDISGSTDAPTVLSMTNHAYWNLAGTTGARATASASIRDHVVSVAADRVVAVDDAMLPTGRLDPVDGTPWDLRHPRRLGDVLDQPELAELGGLDHCLVVASTPRRRGGGFGAGEDPPPAVVLVDPTGGRRLRVHTDQPGVQVYTSNHGAGPLPPHGAVCLESQHLPDAPNQPHFPSATLRPGQVYRHRQVLVLDTVG